MCATPIGPPRCRARCPPTSSSKGACNGTRTYPSARHELGRDNRSRSRRERQNGNRSGTPATGPVRRPGEPPAGLSQTTVHHVHVTIVASLKYAVRRKLLARNPASDVATSRPRTSVTTTRRCIVNYRKPQTANRKPQTAVLPGYRVGSCSWLRSHRAGCKRPGNTADRRCFFDRDGVGRLCPLLERHAQRPKGCPVLRRRPQVGTEQFRHHGSVVVGWLLAHQQRGQGQSCTARDASSKRPSGSQRSSGPSSGRLASVKMREAVAFTR